MFLTYFGAVFSGVIERIREIFLQNFCNFVKNNLKETHFSVFVDLL